MPNLFLENVLFSGVLKYLRGHAYGKCIMIWGMDLRVPQIPSICLALQRDKYLVSFLQTIHAFQESVLDLSSIHNVSIRSRVSYRF